MDINEKIFSIALSLVACPSANNLWAYIKTERPSDLYKKISENKKLKIQDFLLVQYPENPLDAANKIFERSQSAGIRILDLHDEEYPSLLKEIDRPPVVLYLSGSIKDIVPVAVVGTRKADYRSRNIARRIAADLSKNGYTVVSGMAIGIDRESHLGGLDYGGGTAGILANGIDVVYPKSNRDVFQKIKNSSASALMSEYPPGIFAGIWTFVRRNRIISGMSIATVIIKAGIRSGAMITAGHAIDQNRDVFVCPGHALDEGYAGCHRLIQDGAYIVSKTEDILHNLGKYHKNCVENNARETISLTNNRTDLQLESRGYHELDPVSMKILETISGGEADIDYIAEATGLGIKQINEAVMELEIEGQIIRNGNTIVRFRPEKS